MPKNEGGERSEKATPKRLKKARHDGQIGNSPEIGSWLGLLAASFVVPHVARRLMSTAGETLTQVSAVIQNPNATQAMALARTSFRAAFLAALPLSVLVAFVGAGAVAGQGALWFAPGLLKPKFTRLNPLSGAKRLFGPHAWWSLTKSLLKTAALAGVLYLAVRKLVPTVLGSGSLPLGDVVSIGIGSALQVLRFAAVGGLLMALADFAVVRRRNNKQTKMTKHEIKEEMKGSEGDPHVRGQQRSRRLAMRRNRMMADVPTADVVIVNPTHVAVALRYDPAKGAPRVVAKGADHLAARIRQLAEQNRVPMVADVTLARTLHKSCKIGQEIPAELYRSVATVLAFIMTLKRRGSAAGTHTVRTLARAGSSS